MKVLVTRAAEDTAQLAHTLELAGFVPIRVPLLERTWEVEAVAETATCHPDVDWVVVTSAVTADILAAAAPSAWPNAKIAVVGPTTARRLQAMGRPADLIPERHTGMDLIAAMPDLTGQTVLYPKADLAPSLMGDALRARGALVVEVVAYRNAPPVGHREALRNALPVDITTLLSGSAAQRLAKAMEEEDVFRLGHVVAIGPSTAAAAKAAGLPVHAVADPFTLNGLLARLEEIRGLGL